MASVNCGDAARPGGFCTAAEEFGRDRLQAFGGCRLVEPVGARLAEQGVRSGFGGARRLLLLYFFFNFGFHFGQRLEVGVLLVFDADDVEAITALDQIAGLAFGERKSSFFEFRNGAAAADPAQFSAALRAPGIVGVFLRQLCEIAAGLYFLQNVFGLLARFGDCFLIFFRTGRRERGLDQNVADLHLLGNTVLVAMLVVVRLQIGSGNAGLSLQPG